MLNIECCLWKKACATGMVKMHVGYDNVANFIRIDIHPGKNFNGVYISVKLFFPGQLRRDTGIYDHDFARPLDAPEIIIYFFYLIPILVPHQVGSGSNKRAGIFQGINLIIGHDNLLSLEINVT